MKEIINSTEYDASEEFLYNKTYLFIKGYCVGRKLNHALRALPLARALHNGQYRKGKMVVDGNAYAIPYLLHCLKTCSCLISLNLPLSHEEEDIMLAAAILHDSLEDAKEMFPDGGNELVDTYGFPEEVLTIIRLLSKHSGATQEELKIYFEEIQKNKLAMMIKLSDRSNNSESLYEMKPEKMHKYVKETRSFIYPMCSYGKITYPELSNGITILKSKILSLTESTEAIAYMYEREIAEKEAKIKVLERKVEGLEAKLAVRNNSTKLGEAYEQNRD